MNYARLTTEYLCYLMNRAQIEAEGSYGYLKLCTALMNHNFYPLLTMDENRSYECRMLRQDFADEYRYDEVGDILDGIYGENGTMMEILVVLAEKMCYDLSDSEYESEPGKWFKEMLVNCGLGEICNSCYERNDRQEDEVTDILDRIIYRQFGWDGEGSFFPLRCPKHDQRYVELIVQMNDYIEENYDICK